MAATLKTMFPIGLFAVMRFLKKRFASHCVLSEILFGSILLSMVTKKIGCLLIAIVAILVVQTGCATRPKIDWNARVGNYTFDDAVREMGPPDKSAKLSDGTLVCEWLTMKGYSRGHYVYFPGSLPYYWTDPPSPDRFLRLTFSPDGKLIEWKRYAR